MDMQWRISRSIVTCHPPPLGHGTKQESAKYTLKLRNQIIVKHECGRGLHYLKYLVSIILISLKAEVAQILDCFSIC